jgi:hypothetical protein
MKAMRDVTELMQQNDSISDSLLGFSNLIVMHVGSVKYAIGQYQTKVGVGILCFSKA